MLFKRLREDRLILICTLVLMAFGLVMVYSASSVMAMNMKQYADPEYFLKRQAVWAFAGLIGMVVMWRTDYRVLRRFTFPLIAICFVLLVLTLVPGIGAELNGARRWVRLGGLSFQPSEMTKLAMVIFMASSLSRRSDRLHDFGSGVVPYIVSTGVMLLLIALEPDLGTAAAIGAVVFAMLFVAGARPAHLLAIVLAAAPVLYLQLFHVGFRKKRLLMFFDPWSDPRGAGFQAIQSFLAFGSGGLTGLGLGEGRQKLLFLPEPHSDFIFSVVGEELGLVGALGLASLFALFTLLGLRLALRCEDGFGRLLAFGITLMIGLQALINMGVATGLFPNKGMPLPFISAGGSSVFIALVAVGILLSVSRTHKTPEPAHGYAMHPRVARA